MQRIYEICKRTQTDPVDKALPPSTGDMILFKSSLP